MAAEAPAVEEVPAAGRSGQRFPACYNRVLPKSHRKKATAGVTRKHVAVVSIVLGSLGVALWLEIVPARLGGGQFGFAGFALAIALAAWSGGFRAGLFSILAAAVLSDYFLFKPGTFLTFDSVLEIRVLMGFVVGWSMVCLLVARTNRRMKRDGVRRSDAERSAAHADRLVQLTAELGVIESIVPLVAAKQIDLRFDGCPMVKIHGDLPRLEQVFLNIFGNAVKFTPPGRRISVDTGIIEQMLEIRVTDTGIGIDQHFVPHVFDRFQQGGDATARNHGGLGLGLAIARQLVDAHKGSIAVDSGGTGLGATFTVRLPIVKAQPVEDTAPRFEPFGGVSPNLDGVRVLIVDDEPDAREIMKQALEEYGAEITVAEDAAEAFEILNHGEMDVLVADLTMPVEDGYSLIRRVRRSNVPGVATIPAAAVTARVRDDEQRRAIAGGFQVHVSKPFELIDLARAVDKLAHDPRSIH